MLAHLWLWVNPAHFPNKVEITEFISVCRMGWYLIWGTSCFYKSKTEEAKRGEKSAFGPSCAADCYNSGIYSSLLHAYVLYHDRLIHLCMCNPEFLLERKKNNKFCQVRSEKQNASKILQENQFRFNFSYRNSVFIIQLWVNLVLEGPATYCQWHPQYS